MGTAIQDLSDAIADPNLPDNQIQGEGRVSKGAAYVHCVVNIFVDQRI